MEPAQGLGTGWALARALAPGLHILWYSQPTSIYYIKNPSLLQPLRSLISHQASPTKPAITLILKPHRGTSAASFKNQPDLITSSLLDLGFSGVALLGAIWGKQDPISAFVGFLKVRDAIIEETESKSDLRGQSTVKEEPPSLESLRR